jgi:hypothetical protein
MADTNPTYEQHPAEPDAPFDGAASSDDAADPKVSVAPSVVGEPAEGTPPTPDPDAEQKQADERRALQAEQLAQAKKIFP